MLPPRVGNMRGILKSRRLARGMVLVLICRGIEVKRIFDGRKLVRRVLSLIVLVVLVVVSVLVMVFVFLVVGVGSGGVFVWREW